MFRIVLADANVLFGRTVRDVPNDSELYLEVAGRRHPTELRGNLGQRCPPRA